VIPFTDLDEWDREPETRLVLACRDSAAVGTVRVYRPDGGDRWRGDRLAVLPGHRASLVGAKLVRYAVSTAAGIGGEVMDAFVQNQNVGFFERLGWRRDGGEILYFGLAHQPMVFDLADSAFHEVDDAPVDARLELPAHRDDPSPLLEALEVV